MMSLLHLKKEMLRKGHNAQKRLIGGAFHCSMQQQHYQEKKHECPHLLLVGIITRITSRSQETNIVEHDGQIDESAVPAKFKIQKCNQLANLHFQVFKVREISLLIQTLKKLNDFSLDSLIQGLDSNWTTLSRWSCNSYSFASSIQGAFQDTEHHLITVILEKGRIGFLAFLDF